MALGVAAGLVGTFLLLRKRALTADALSHATLPGITVAFMVMVAFGMQGKSMLGLMTGAFVFGCIGVLLIIGIRRTTRLKDDAAIGIVLSVLFGLGLCLLRLATEMPSGNTAGLNGFIFGKAASMVASDTKVIASVALCTGFIVVTLRKEFTALCFDENFGAVQGWPILRLDILLMSLVAIVTVIALQSVARRSKQSPSPKRTLNTIPIAASSLSLVVLLIPMISKTPMQPKTNAPVISPSIDLPCMPKATITIKATVIPGNVA